MTTTCLCQSQGVDPIHTGYTEAFWVQFSRFRSPLLKAHRRRRIWV